MTRIMFTGAMLLFLAAAAAADPQPGRNSTASGFGFVTMQTAETSAAKKRTTPQNKPAAGTNLKTAKPDPVPCDCTNCSAEHCQPKTGGSFSLRNAWPSKWYMPEPGRTGSD